MSNDDKVEPIIGSAKTENSILDELDLISKLEPEVETNSDSISATKPTTTTSSLKMFFRKENRYIIIGGALILSLAIGAIVLISYQFNKPKGKQNRVVNSVATIEKNQPVGAVPALREEEIQLANEEIRNSDAFGYEIALEGDMKDESAVQSFKTATAPKCIDTDTACYRIEGLIKPDECAPKDAACLEKRERELSAAGITVTTNSKNDPNQIYLDRLNNPEYKKNLIAEFNKIAKDYADTPESFGADIPKRIEEDTNKGEERTDSSNQVQSDKIRGVLQSKNLVELIHNAGDRAFAIADIALNSKIQGPVSLTVFDPIFGETVAIGKSVRVDDYMRLELNTWVLPDHRECAIQAIALDSKTTYAAIASRVDHHTLYRYGWWGLGTTLEVIGTAAQFGANQSTVVSDGVVIETTETTAEREAKIALGGLGKEIGRVMSKRLDTPSTVFVDKDEQMGFFFLKRVTSDDCK